MPAIGVRWVLIAVLVILAGTLAWAYNERTKQYVAVQLEYTQLQEKWRKLEADLANERTAHANLRARRTAANSQFTAVKSDLSQYKGKSETLVQKLPEVTTRVQASFDAYVKSMQCETGEVSVCQN